MAKLKKSKIFNECQQVRKMLITHSTLNLLTGKITQGKKEWVTRPCGVPLFDPKHKKLGFCKACQGGWTHPHNYPV